MHHSMQQREGKPASHAAASKGLTATGSAPGADSGTAGVRDSSKYTRALSSSIRAERTAPPRTSVKKSEYTTCQFPGRVTTRQAPGYCQRRRKSLKICSAKHNKTCSGKHIKANILLRGTCLSRGWPQGPASTKMRAHSRCQAHAKHQRQRGRPPAQTRHSLYMLLLQG